MLLENQSFTRDSYSTRGFLAGISEPSNSNLWIVHSENGTSIVVEGVSPEVSRFCEERGLTLESDSRVDSVAEVLAEAFVLIERTLPSLSAVVSELAWRCHIVVAQHDDYDVSFSDPDVPFSIFVSVPIKQNRISVLRVAENLVHEVMHLQLTLFEGVCPLVKTDKEWSIYSPWKKTVRPTQGVLHALYVFTVLRWMWLGVASQSCDLIDKAFAERRVSEITEEVQLVIQLEESPALTDAGSRLSRMLFAEQADSDR